MCATCGCMKPKDKHGMKTVSAANKKFAGKGKCAKCGKTPCACKKAPAKKTAPKKKQFTKTIYIISSKFSSEPE